MRNLREILLASDFSSRSDRPLARATQLAADSGATLVIAYMLESRRTRSWSEAEARARLVVDLPPELRDTPLLIEHGSPDARIAAIAAERGSDLIVLGVARQNSIGDYLTGSTVDHIIRHAETPVLVVRRRCFGPYASLIAATDFSHGSRQAVLKAAELFPGTPIHLVHSFLPPYSAWLKSDDVQAEVALKAREEMDAFIAEVREAAGPDLVLSGEVVEGEAGSVIPEIAFARGADLMILGTHGQSGFSHATVGSTAEVLLTLVGCDALVVQASA